jgi:Domain of Unknown Function (DUF349)
MSADEFQEAVEPPAEDAVTGDVAAPGVAPADDAVVPTEAPAEAAEPVAESLDEALAEETPAAEQPVAEEPVAAEEQPVAEEAPAPVEEARASAEEQPVAEEAPAPVEEAPASAEEQPVAEEAPAPGEEAPAAAAEPAVEVPAAEPEPAPTEDAPTEAAPEPAAEVEAAAAEPATEADAVTAEPVAEAEAAPAEPVAEAASAAAEPMAEAESAEPTVAEPATEPAPAGPAADTAPVEAAADAASSPAEAAPAAETASVQAAPPAAASASADDAVAADSPDAAKVVRTAIVEEAERLSTSSDWTKAANGYRELLARWRAVGSAGREVDDALWARFSTARDTFFERRNAHHAERSRLAAEAAEKKKALIVECEGLLELGDPRKLGDGLDRLMAEWKAAGRAGSEDQALWQQFRAARDRVFALRRELAAARQRRRDDVKVAKEGLIEEARAVGSLPPEQLQAELDRLMTAWKRAGSAGRDTDDALWQQFREARGVGFSRLRQANARAERQAQSAAAAAEQTVVAAQRMAFSDSAVSQDDVDRLERTFARASDTVDAETKEQFQEALGRLRDRAEKSATAIPSTNPLSAARAKLEQGVKELEERVATLRAEGSRDLGRAEKRLAEERQKLERMHSLMGS